jgi:hypothetical protein
MADKLTLQQTTQFPNGVTIPAGGLEIPENFLAVMTVDGVATRVQPGEYKGSVVIELLEQVPALGKVELPPFHGGGGPELVQYKHPYRSALMVDTDKDGKQFIDEKRSALTAIVGAEISESGIKGGEITTHDDWFNGITVADGEFRIENMKLNMEGRGGDDFEMFGCGIAAGGNSKVVINNVDIQTAGNISTAVDIAEKANVLIENCNFKTVGDENREWRENTMTHVPWVMGLKGTVRSVNAIGSTVSTFYNTVAESNGWGVYSTDDAHSLKHNLINSKAVISKDGEYQSGYGAYVLGEDTSTFLGAEFENTTYGLVFAGSGADVVVGPSSKENLVRRLGEDSLLAKETNGFADVPEKNTQFHCVRNAMMFHGNATSPQPSKVEIQAGTELVTGEATFVVKAEGRTTPDGQKSLGTSPEINVTGAKVQNNGVLLHFMESDDPGMGQSGFDKHWAEYYLVPEIDPQPFPGFDKCHYRLPGTMNASFHDMTVSGDIYNTVWKTPQNLNVELDNVKYTGAITTGVQFHKNFKPGEKIMIDNPFEIGNVGVTPKPNHNNGLIVTLRRGATWCVTGNSYLSMFVMFQDSAVTAVGGKRVIMTVDGVRKNIVPGIYRGDIRFELIDEVPSIGKYEVASDFSPSGVKQVHYEHPYESALTVDTDASGKTGVLVEKSATSMLVGSTFDDKGITGGKIVNECPRANIITVIDGEYRISDLTIESRAHGADDFEAYGASIAAAGQSKVVVDNVTIDNVGAVCTAVDAVEKADVLVMNSTIKTKGLDPDTCWADAMTEVPWVLGLKGSVRSTNVCDEAHATYYNCDMVSNGWGVLSTDDISEGAQHNIVNTKAVIEEDGIFDSGYVVYALGKVRTKIFGAEMASPDYPITFGGNSNDIFIGASDKATLEKYLGTDTLLAKETNGYATVEARRTKLDGGCYALMWHHVCTGKVTVENSDLRGDRCVFLMKAIEGNMFGKIMPPSSPTLEVKNCTLASKNGVILHLMENDDAGMGIGGHDLHWADSYTVPDTTPVVVEGWNAADPEAQSTIHVSFADMEMAGDIYNTRFGSGHNLAVSLENVQYAGAITAGRQYHKSHKPGDKILPTEPRELGNVGCLPAPVVCNGVIVDVKAGANWTVTGTSFLSSLTIAEGATVAAAPGTTLTLLVDGKETELAPGAYTGNIELKVAKVPMPF